MSILLRVLVAFPVGLGCLLVFILGLFVAAAIDLALLPGKLGLAVLRVDFPVWSALEWTLALGERIIRGDER